MSGEHLEPNPRPRLFEFCTGDEIDVDRYVSLNLRDHTAHFQMRGTGYIRVEFDSVEEMRREIERMRQFRDEYRGAVAGVARDLEGASDEQVREYIESGRLPKKPIKSSRMAMDAFIARYADASISLRDLDAMSIDDLRSFVDRIAASNPVAASVLAIRSQATEVDE